MMADSSKLTLYSAVASRLAQDLAGMPGPRLPSQRSLYTHYGVSQATFKAAVSLLERQGILQTVAPGRIRICGRQEPPITERLSSVETVCRHIQKGVMDGRYRNGDALPKMAALAADLAVSTHSVLRAYHRLGRQNLLYRRGKSWITGMPQTKVNTRSWKTVIVLTHQPASWNGLDTAPRTRGFCMAFSREAQLHNVQTVTVCGAQAPNGSVSFPSGIDAILRKIDEYGTDFIGMLVAASRKEMPDLEFLSMYLHKKRRPLVWFDRYDEGCGGLSIPVSGNGQTTPWFTRCHFDETAAVTLALKRLVDAGHRTIGFVYHGHDRWIRSRLAMLERVAEVLGKENGSAVKIVSYPHDTLLNNLRDVNMIRERLEQLTSCNLPMASGLLLQHLRRTAKNGSHAGKKDRIYQIASDIAPGNINIPDLGKPQIDILTYASVFCPYLQDPGITAIITPNDAKAYLYYRHLTALGVRIPETYSLISFDNYVSDQPSYPVTSTDFGFDSLGYAAFHAIMGHLPVNRSRCGDIAAMPRIVERGSIRRL